MMVLLWLRAARPFAVQSLRRRGMAVGALPTVVLEKGKARLFQDGNPIIYGGAVKAVEGKPEPGSEVAVTDHMGNSIGRGIFNPHSTYRVRMLSRAYESVHTLPLLDLLKARIEQAVALRASIGLPSKTNSVYRLINGEGDRLGGLVVDVFDKVVVAQSSALWAEVHKARIEEALLATLPGAGGKKKPVVVWRRAESRLKQDGWTGDMSDDQVPDSLRGAILQVKENGLKFAVSPESGQKTGFYADQRANRLALRAACAGKTVLDTYCYTGGFALNALTGGASHVVAVDSSQPALDAAAGNARLNGFSVAAAPDASLPAAPASASGQLELVKGDCVEVMRRLAEEGRQFDIVVCDPPKLAPSRKDLEKARNKYVKINTLAVSLVRPGGLLLTCTCSAAMTQDGLEQGGGGGLLRVVGDAARQARREVTLLSTSGAAPDHPVSLGYREGAYLTSLLLHVH